jgi:hypothetical protein
MPLLFSAVETLLHVILLHVLSNGRRKLPIIPLFKTKFLKMFLRGKEEEKVPWN